ncbi:MAG: RNA polymerase sigma factor [Terracidiphilus sp.]
MGKNDHASIQAVLSGDKDAYGVLVAQHSRSVFRVAYRITGNEADAEEVVQDAFLRGYRKLESFESRSNFGTWIYRIAVRCAVDRISHRGSDKKSRPNANAEEDPEAVRVPDRAPSPEQVLLSGEIGAFRESAMHSLTPLERAAFTLRHMEDCSMEEIAAALEIAPNAAKQAVYRAVQKLRQRLALLKVRT